MGCFGSHAILAASETFDLPNCFYLYLVVYHISILIIKYIETVRSFLMYLQSTDDIHLLAIWGQRSYVQDIQTFHKGSMTKTFRMMLSWRTESPLHCSSFSHSFLLTLCKRYFRFSTVQKCATSWKMMACFAFYTAIKNSFIAYHIFRYFNAAIILLFHRLCKMDTFFVSQKMFFCWGWC